MGVAKFLGATTQWLIGFPLTMFMYRQMHYCPPHGSRCHGKLFVFWESRYPWYFGQALRVLTGNKFSVSLTAPFSPAMYFPCLSVFLLMLRASIIYAPLSKCLVGWNDFFFGGGGGLYWYW